MAPQIEVTDSLIEGREGDAYGSSYNKLDMSLLNASPQAVQSVVVSVTGATNSKAYIVNINSVPVSYLSDGSATQQEIADGLVAAINNEPAVSGSVIASSGTNAFTVASRSIGLSFTLTEDDAQLSLSSTAGVLASPVPFGRLVLFDAAREQACRVLSASAFTGRVAVFTPTAVNSTTYAINLEINGQHYLISYLSDGSATVQEIVEGLAASAAGQAALSLYVTATEDNATLTLTAINGSDFLISAVTPVASLVITSDTPGTTLAGLAGGVAIRTNALEVTSQDGVDGYGPNSVCAIRKRGMARVFSEDATLPGGQVFVRVAASGANTEIGRFRATAAAGCVLLPQARWQTARNGQNLAIVSLNID
jgi:hypothetical protein